MSRDDSVQVLCVHGDTMQCPTTEVEIKMGHWIQRVKVAIAPSLPVDVLLGWDIFCSEVRPAAWPRPSSGDQELG